MPLIDKLKKAGTGKILEKKRTEPLWKGPCAEGPLGGCTFSMLNAFLGCRERFRIRYVEGLRPTEQFNHRIFYGSAWHTCEESLARSEGEENWGDWEGALGSYAAAERKKFPLQQEQISHWTAVCRTQFPLYVEFWSQQPDVKDRTPLLQEQTFDVPYRLPSGRVVRLRGKWDSVDLIGRGKGAGIFLQENKTKADIDENLIKRQLLFDLQTCLYLVALDGEIGIDGKNKSRTLTNMWSKGEPIRGVRYNVVRRPLSGGKGSIVQHKPTKSNPQGESKEEYYARLSDIIKGASGPDWGVGPKENFFFRRWKVDILPADIARFRRECLDPLLEQLCLWYEFISKFGDNPFVGGNCYHWRHPFGATNFIDDGGFSDVDSYLESGSEIGLERVDSLFSELQ